MGSISGDPNFIESRLQTPINLYLIPKQSYYIRYYYTKILLEEVTLRAGSKPKERGEIKEGGCKPSTKNSRDYKKGQGEGQG